MAIETLRQTQKSRPPRAGRSTGGFICIWKNGKGCAHWTGKWSDRRNDRSEFESHLSEWPLNGKIQDGIIFINADVVMAVAGRHKRRSEDL